MTSLKAVCVFCGSGVGRSPRYAEAARELALLMAARGIRLIYGGGGIGLMGVLADTMLAEGGAVTGIIPRFLRKDEIAHGGVEDMIVVDSMHTRKARMFALADGFITLPGGLGTLDETMEIVTWRQLALHDKPIAIVDSNGYWRPLNDLLDRCIDEGFAGPGIKNLYTVVSTPAAALDTLAAAHGPRVEEQPSRL